MLALVALEAAAYKIKYADCSSPSKIARLDINHACNTTANQINPKKTYGLLQRKREYTLSGYRCAVERSDWWYYCGAYSHTKILRPPSIDIKSRVTPLECRQMITTLEFAIPGSSNVRPIELGAENIIKVDSLGTIHTDANVWCQGQQLKVGNAIVEDVLQLTQFRITITEEEYVVKQDRVEALSSHTRLPGYCAAALSGCESPSRDTFIWDVPDNTCEVQLVQEISLEQEGSVYVDHDKKLCFELSDSMPSPLGCPAGSILTTNYHDLYLTTEVRGYPKLNPRDVDMSLYIDTRLSYLQLNLEKKSAELSQSLAVDICENRYSSKTHRMIKLSLEGRYGMRSGDAFLMFDCPVKVGRIANPTEECYDAIRLENGLYVDVVTRIAHKHASPTDCSRHFPMYVETLNNGWITISDTIHEVTPPETRTITAKTLHHESFAKKGMYTANELEQWEAIASWGTFQDAVGTRVAKGVCASESGPCRVQPGVSTSYDLRRLLSVPDLVSPFHKFNVWVRDNVGYLCVAVLTVVALQLIIVLTMVSWTMCTHGTDAALSALFVACCTGPHLVAKVRRLASRNKRYASAPSAPSAEQGHELNPLT